MDKLENVRSRVKEVWDRVFWKVGYWVQLDVRSLVLGRAQLDVHGLVWDQVLRQGQKQMFWSIPEQEWSRSVEDISCLNLNLEQEVLSLKKHG